MIKKYRKLLIGCLIALYFPVWMIFHSRNQKIKSSSYENSHWYSSSKVREQVLVRRRNDSLVSKHLSEISNISAEIFNRTRSHVYVTVINSAFMNLTRNWLCNTAPMPKIHNNSLILCSDLKTCETLKAEYPRANYHGFDLAEAFGYSMSWGARPYISFLALRTEILQALTARDVPFILFEADATWFKDPWEYFQKHAEDSDIKVPLKGTPDQGLTLSFDPLMVRPTAASKSFFKELSEILKSDPKKYDQDVLDMLCKQQFSGAVCTTFPWDEIGDGTWFKMSDYSRKKSRPYIVNNNYYVGIYSKISRQALNGFWFLDTKYKCELPKVEEFLSINK